MNLFNKLFLGILAGLIITGLAVAGVWYVSNQEQETETNNNDPISIDTSDWETYVNEDYGFFLKYPENWLVAEEVNDPISPKFNIYKSSSEVGQPPYDHHSSEAIHVSVFPQGIPTEGVSAESVSSEVNFKVDVLNARDYILADNTPFATQANFSSSPQNWNDSGFIFANNPIIDLETECLRDGEPVSGEECEVLMGDTLIRYGSTDKEIRAIQVAILESFGFLDQDDNGEKEDNDLIQVFEPEENSIVSNPLKITGQARGTWYFEATFPVRIEDALGNVLGEYYATAQDDWMTEEFVEFESELSFDKPSKETGTLILEKANPSGLEEHSDELLIPVRFNLEAETPTRTIKLYYYNPDLDKDEEGNTLCSKQGLVAVERDIPVTETPIQDAIKLLLEGDLTTREKEQGLTTEYPLEDFELVEAALNNGTLNLEFDDPNYQTGGGSCRVAILWAQIAETAKQFEVVEEVSFQPEELFQP